MVDVFMKLPVVSAADKPPSWAEVRAKRRVMVKRVGESILAVGYEGWRIRGGWMNVCRLYE
jgi:hypothetical protein